MNTWFDQVFYDVSCVSAAEQELLPPLGLQPLLFCVPPSGQGKLTFHHSVAELKASQNPPQIFALAGAVSASLGGVAFARNLADSLAQPVCVILPGTAPGGWADQWSFFPKWGTQPEQVTDAEVLLEILRDSQLPVTHLVGHSKGCLGLSQALLELERSGWRQGAFKPIVITLGGVVEIPSRVGAIHQLLGDFDWLGSFNSRLDLDHQRVSGSGHHLNRQLPFHLDVCQVVREMTTAG